MKNYTSKNQLIILGVGWFLLAPLIFLYVKEGIASSSDTILYAILYGLLLIGGILLGLGYYLKYAKIKSSLRIGLFIIVTLVYVALGYYYFILLSVLFALS